ncbi:hypothetical protein BJY04DRAFT_216059 [Aspergillus karnatakaensis]|uniref:GPI anchored serine-threonine rich family protein n=1 Tax=Aspergillus karnatakaensis TaxID=1810916 RepID=UPI003CCD7ED3
MRLLKHLLATWACLAQVSFAGVAFTKWPTTVYTGQPATMTWNGDPNIKPATITLRKGPSGDLKTLKVLTTQAGGGSFTWVPEDSLVDGSDYALQIEQNGSVNYSGLVTLAHQPGKEPPSPAPPSSKIGPRPSDITSPLGGTRHSIQKGNNAYLPALNSSSTRHNMTQNKSTTPSPSNDGASFRYLSPEVTLAALAIIVYFAA